MRSNATLASFEASSPRSEEGLRVIALARGGRSEEAEQRASAFRKRYPKSVLLPATEAAVESEPKP
jgi:hypothetical protein